MKYKVLVEGVTTRGKFDEFKVISHHVQDGLLHLVTGRLKCGVTEETAISLREIVGFFTEDIDA